MAKNSAPKAGDALIVVMDEFGLQQLGSLHSLAGKDGDGVPLVNVTLQPHSPERLYVQDVRLMAGLAASDGVSRPVAWPAVDPEG
jgi:hypothetical protein